MRGLKKKFFDPSFVLMRFLRPRQGKRARSKKIVSHFLHQNETTAG
jgi:hypothetical protein